MAQRLLTLGHGTSTAQELADLIRRAAIESIVDVRALPKSRRHPQFWREEMERWVPELSGSRYGWEPALGGFRKRHSESPNIALRNPSFRAYADYMQTAAFELALAGVLAQTARAQVAILCSETLWWRCHRRLVADAVLLVRGVDVAHLMHDGTTRAHVPTAGVRVTEAGTICYDAVEQTGP